MRLLHLFVLPAVGLLAFAPALLLAKPPTKETPKPATPLASSASSGNPAVDPTARWLLEQDGAPGAIALPLREIIAASTRIQVAPFDRADPQDAAFLAKLDALMGRVLPRINCPNSPVHAAAQLREIDEAVARIEDEILDTARDASGFLPSPLSGRSSARTYPGLRLYMTRDKAYYVSVTLYPIGKREEATRTDPINRALRLDPVASGNFFGDNGCCLLIGIEYDDKKGTDLAFQKYNDKLGSDLVFLNWDLVDVVNVPVRAAITFDANGADIYHPGAVLTDGRKGSD